MLTGTITYIGPHGVMFIVALQGGEFVVFELLDSVDLRVGQVVSGRLYALGSEKLLNVDDGQAFDRPGRATLLLTARDDRLVATHSHFSLAPRA